MWKHLLRILAIKGLFFTLIQELKNIENRVAWFLAELCKAKKTVQKDKANQRRTKLVRGCLAPRLAHGIDLLKQNEYPQEKGNSIVATFS
jgi:type III secretory pathway lipoprotein EscJ